ncbi:MAG: iron hydrogenase, partial [Planctomycetes bacterium]|nr:iron hydrogenase [Planctomycetota bacterium]
AKPNPTGCKDVSAFLAERGISKPVVNVPGCPPHPDWLLGTVASIVLKGLPGVGDVDDIGRLKVFFGGLIHDNCPRRGFFDAGQFAKRLSEPGCLYELGCKGPQTYADCPTRHWNNGVNWCIGNGSPCHGCVEPEFPDQVSPLYRKLTRERFGELKVATRA